MMNLISHISFILIIWLAIKLTIIRQIHINTTGNTFAAIN